MESFNLTGNSGESTLFGFREGFFFLLSFFFLPVVIVSAERDGGETGGNLVSWM